MSDRPVLKIEITKGMIAAGAYELNCFSARDDDDETAVVMIYRAMVMAKEEQKRDSEHPADFPPVS